VPLDGCSVLSCGWRAVEGLEWVLARLLARSYRGSATQQLDVRAPCASSSMIAAPSCCLPFQPASVRLDHRSVNIDILRRL